MTDNNPNFYEYRAARFMKDIERCPYISTEPGYEEWNGFERDSAFYSAIMKKN